MVPLFLFLCLAPFSHAADTNKIPSYVKTLCKRNDPEINKCAFKAANEILPHIINGDPKIKLLPLDPMRVDLIQLKPLGNSKSVGFLLKCVKCNITGLGKTDIKEINLDLKKMELNMKTRIPEMIIQGDYEASGNILLLPITGKGKGTVKATKIDVDIKMKMKLKKIKGEEYLEVTEQTVNFIMNYFYINLENLFNGDKLLGDNMNKFMNENWKELMVDLQPTISDTIGQIIKTITNQVFVYLPYNTIIPE